MQGANGSKEMRARRRAEQTTIVRVDVALPILVGVAGITCKQHARRAAGVRGQHQRRDLSRRLLLANPREDRVR